MANESFGLDIGRSFIKVVEVKTAGKKRILTAAANAPTPAGGIQTDAPLELKKVTDAIKAVVKTSGVKTNKCNVSIVESQVVTRLIQMPNLTDRELSSAINWEADQYIPLPLKEVNLRYEVISRPSDGKGGKMDVLLVAAPKRVIEKYIRLVADSGLQLEAIETESTSLVRALATLADLPLIIVSMGAVSVELVLARNAKVLFTRSILGGGYGLTRAIMAEFNMNQTQAERYKHAYGVLENQLGGKVAAALKPLLEVIVLEILKALEYSRSHLVGTLFDRIIICGGGAYLPGLSEYLNQRTSLVVSLGDPWLNFVKEGLVLKMPSQGSFYTVATGLAIRS
jgi:type IV pilus assembly protein PilM